MNRSKGWIDWNRLPRRHQDSASDSAPAEPSRLGDHSDIQGISRPRGSVSNFDQHPVDPVLDLKPGDSEVTDASARPIDDDASLVRCVMLISADEHPPQQLLNLLKQPASTVDRAEHPLLAVARLSTLERGRKMRAEWTPDTDERTVLVVVNRDVWRDLSPLFQTIRQIMPSVGIWVCTERVAIEVYAGQPETSPESTVKDVVSVAPHDFDEAISPAEPRESPKLTTLSDEEMRDLLDLFENADDEGPDDPPTLGLSGGPRTS
jgi:hypothetical protein